MRERVSKRSKVFPASQQHTTLLSTHRVSMTGTFETILDEFLFVLGVLFLSVQQECKQDTHRKSQFRAKDRNGRSYRITPATVPTLYMYAVSCASIKHTFNAHNWLEMGTSIYYIPNFKLLRAMNRNGGSYRLTPLTVPTRLLSDREGHRKYHPVSSSL